MNVTFRKSFFNDLEKIRDPQIVQEIRFIVELANKAKSPDKIPGFKALRQYPQMGRIEVSPFRIGVESARENIIFKRVLPRSFFYLQFP